MEKRGIHHQRRDCFLSELGNASVYRLFMMLVFVSLLSGGLFGIAIVSFARSGGFSVIAIVSFARREGCFLVAKA